MMNMPPPAPVLAGHSLSARPHLQTAASWLHADTSQSQDVRRCSCCGFVSSASRPFWFRPKLGYEVCPVCRSWSRHRIICHFLAKFLAEPPAVATRRVLAANDSQRVLHFAPEPFVMPHVKAAFPVLHEYVAADLNGNEGRTGASTIVKHIDVMNIGERTDSFDGVIVLHVLEHVRDDRLALRELHRVLKPGAWAMLMVPARLMNDHALNETVEDDRIVDERERIRIFGQADHVRAYAAHDFRRRASAAGLRCCPFFALDAPFFLQQGGPTPPPTAVSRYHARPDTREADLFCRKPPYDAADASTFCRSLLPTRQMS